MPSFSRYSIPMCDRSLRFWTLAGPQISRARLGTAHRRKAPITTTSWQAMRSQHIQVPSPSQKVRGRVDGGRESWWNSCFASPRIRTGIRIWGPHFQTSYPDSHTSRSVWLCLSWPASEQSRFLTEIVPFLHNLHGRLRNSASECIVTYHEEKRIAKNYNFTRIRRNATNIHTICYDLPIARLMTSLNRKASTNFATQRTPTHTKKRNFITYYLHPSPNTIKSRNWHGTEPGDRWHKKRQNANSD